MILRCTAIGLLFLSLILPFHVPCFAGTTKEIAGLLQFIEQSGCTFIRNGKQYDSLAARQHIEKKYNYYKERITTAEEFIQYSASKSSFTGKPYMVLCNGIRINSSNWLNAELNKARMR